MVGKIYSVAMWAQNGVSASQVTALFQNPRKDRRQAFGNYDSTMRDGLLHYWWPTLWTPGDETSLGNDYGLVGTARNIMDDQTEITSAADLVPDAP